MIFQHGLGCRSAKFEFIVLCLPKRTYAKMRQQKLGKGAGERRLHQIKFNLIEPADCESRSVSRGSAINRHVDRVVMN